MFQCNKILKFFWLVVAAVKTPAASGLREWPEILRSHQQSQPDPRAKHCGSQSGGYNQKRVGEELALLRVTECASARVHQGMDAWPSGQIKRN